MKKMLFKYFFTLIVAFIACLSLVIGIATAWYVNQYRLASIAKIHPLTYISILAPGDTVIQSIDLSYDKSEVTNGTVTIKRPFVIRSNGEKIDLCIAHTTNIAGLNIELYEASDNGVQGDAYLAGITDKGLPYYWNKKNDTNVFATGNYVNDTDNNKVADLHDAFDLDDAFIETFRLTNNDVYQNVQQNARPLYWVLKNYTGSRREGDNEYYYINFILELSWVETDKETDILYIIAQTSDTTGMEGN